MSLVMQVFWMHPYRGARESQQQLELCLSEAEHLREHRDLLFPSTRAAWCMSSQQSGQHGAWFGLQWSTDGKKTMCHFPLVFFCFTFFCVCL